MFSISTDSDQQDDAQFEVDEYLSFNDEEEKEDTSLLPPERQQKHFTLQTHTDHHGCIKKEYYKSLIIESSFRCYPFESVSGCMYAEGEIILSKALQKIV